jgi:hypothetical protein
MRREEKMEHYSGRSIDIVTQPLRMILALGLTYWMIVGNEPPFDYLFGALFSLASLDFMIDFVQKIYHSPRKVTIEDGYLTAHMLYGRMVRLAIMDILSVRDIPALQIIVDHTIVLKTDRERLFLGRDLTNLRDFLLQLKAINPRCVIEGKYLEKALEENSP